MQPIEAANRCSIFADFAQVQGSWQVIEQDTQMMGPSLDLSANENSKEQVKSGGTLCDIGNSSRLMRSDLDPGGGDRPNGHSDMADQARTSLDVPSEGLGPRGSRRNSSSGPQSGTVAPIPPDGGWGWMIVVGSILVVGIVPALFVCFGVFMNAFLNVFPEVSKSSASWIPAIMNALMNFMGPITSALVTRYSARLVAFLGGIILSSGLILSYFTTTVHALYLTYGVLGGIGAGLSLPPGLYLISQYFRRRRGVATGVCMAGGSLFQILFPFLLQKLLNEYNYNGCILIMGGLTMHICVSAALYRSYDPYAARKTARSKSVDQFKNRKSKRRSSPSLTFLTDDGVVSTKRGSYWAVPEAGHAKKSKTKKKSKKKSQRKRVNRTDSTGNTAEKNTKSIESNLLLSSDKTWQSISPSEVIIIPKVRPRTLSVDSTRTLPDIPEEREDDGATNVASKAVEEQQIDDGLSDAVKPTVSALDEAELKDVPSSNDAGEPNGDVTEGLLSTEVPVVEIRQPDVAIRTPELVTLNHIFGSVASIVVDDSQQEARKRRTRLNKITFKQLCDLMGFAHFREGIFYVLSSSFTFIMITMTCFTMFIPTYGVSMKLSRDTAAGLLSVIAIASAFGRLILPSLSDYVVLQRKHIYAISSAVTSCAILGTIFVRDYTDLVCCLVFFGFASGGCLAISINVFLDYIKLEHFTSFFGLVGLVVGTGTLFGAPIMGLMVDLSGSYNATFVSLALSSALSGAILYLDRFTGTKSMTSKKRKPTPV